MMDVKDKNMIWDDCSQCAHKHLTAAYAALTGATILREEGVELTVPLDRVFLARAVILRAEADEGYTGNLSLACGCLAMAEAVNTHVSDRKVYREVRLTWSGQRDGELLVDVSPGLLAFAAGHIAEALRELPALTANRELSGAISNGSFFIGDLDAYLDVLKLAIRYLEENFELMKGNKNEQQ